MTEEQVIGKTVRVLLDTPVARVGTSILSPTRVVRAARRRDKRGKFAAGNIKVVLTIGRPNYRTRRFIRQAQRAGEPFPIRRVQLELLPASRAARAKRGRPRR